MQTLLKIIKMIIGILVSIIGMIVLIAIIFINTSPEFGSTSKGERLIKIQASEHYIDGKFKNLTNTDLSGDMNYIKTLSEYFTKGNKVPDWSIL